MEIIIIKLGADGDVLRTIPLANALKNKHPQSNITWLTRGDIATLLNNQPSISQVLILPYVENKVYDLLYNFDIEDQATSLAESIPAKKKYGFCKKDGFISTFNLGGEYYLNTTFDDELKKSNKKTYQEMMFETAELHYEKEPFQLTLTPGDNAFASAFKKKHSLTGKIIGIHMGASSRWPSKVWHHSQVLNFIKSARENGIEIILFGGPNEVQSHAQLVSELKQHNISIYQNNPTNTKREFAALVSLCDLMICSDSLSLHLSIGLGKKTICLFFCTSPAEVEGYGLLTKIVSPKLYEFFPEKSDQYDEALVSSISAADVFQTAQKLLK